VIEAREFGASLRRERERRVVSLDEIAEQTKVSASMLAGLERGDLSRWPTGIFRRAFVRSYAAAVGLDVEDTLAEFLRVFPEDGSRAKPRSASSAGHAMRLSLGDAPVRSWEWRRAAGATIDLAVTAIVLGAVWFVEPLQTACVTALGAAAVWHAIGAVAWGTSPGVHVVRRRLPQAPRGESARLPAPSVEPVAGAAEPSRPATPLLVASALGRGRASRRERRPVLRSERSHGGDARIQRP
jgi:transcriptional regulator with XRE-family HTH domain